MLSVAVNTEQLSVCRPKESGPLWESAGGQWWQPGACRSSSLWAERTRLGSWTLICLSSSWNPLDCYTLRYSLVRHTHTHTDTNPALVHPCRGRELHYLGWWNTDERWLISLWYSVTDLWLYTRQHVKYTYPRCDQIATEGHLHVH